MSERQPFANLGGHLKQLREQARQTLAEVSGAVEIDLSTLERIEDGQERPAEDVLMLLINYFDMPDDTANHLWELAGYMQNGERATNSEDAQKPLVLVLGLDARTLYSDGLDINCTPAGMTLQFTQNGNQPVAKIGMSYEHAAHVAEALQRALLHAKYQRGPRQLPPSNDPR